MKKLCQIQKECQINTYKCKEINYHSRKDDWKIFEKHNPTFPLNIFYIKEKQKKWKTDNFFNDTKWKKRRMTLSCSKNYVHYEMEWLQNIKMILIA